MHEVHRRKVLKCLQDILTTHSRPKNHCMPEQGLLPSTPDADASVGASTHADLAARAGYQQLALVQPVTRKGMSRAEAWYQKQCGDSDSQPLIPQARPPGGLAAGAPTCSARQAAGSAPDCSATACPSALAPAAAARHSSASCRAAASAASWPCTPHAAVQHCWGTARWVAQRKVAGSWVPSRLDYARSTSKLPRHMSKRANPAVNIPGRLAAPCHASAAAPGR